MKTTLSQVLVRLHEHAQFLQSGEFLETRCQSGPWGSALSYRLLFCLCCHEVAGAFMGLQLLLLEDAFNLFVGLFHELWELAFAKDHFYIFVIAVQAFRRHRLFSFLHGYLLIVVILEAIEDMRPCNLWPQS